MTDLRQAAQQALEALCVAVEPKKGKVYAREFEPIDCFAMHEQAITAIKEALEQPEQGPVAKLFGTLPVYDTPPAAQRTWVGLTDEDWDKVGDMPDTFDQGVAWAAARLKEKNGY
jgi:hypothetical protein